MTWQTCILNILLWASCSILCLLLFLYFFDPLNGQNSFWCLLESCREFNPWHLSTGIMSFGPLQHKQSSKHYRCVILWGQNDISIFMICFFQDPSLISPWLLHEIFIIGFHIHWDPLKCTFIAQGIFKLMHTY